MKKSYKRGITTSILLVAIVIMAILIGTASVVGSNAIKTANFENFKSEISRVSDMVNSYSVKNGNLPIRNEIVAVDSMSSDLKSAILSKGDVNENFYVVDVEKLNDSTISLGKGSYASSDVFLVTETTQNIYYLKGYIYNSKIYYNL